jgi:membrane glycosyltransferase
MDTLAVSAVPARIYQRPPARELTPPEQPLEMPEQALGAFPPRPAPHRPAAAATVFARIFVSAVTIGLTAYGAWEMSQVVGDEKATLLQEAFLVLFVLTFGWIAFAAGNAALGFYAVMTRRPSAAAPVGRLTSRTALVMPVYNEETEVVFARLRRMAQALIGSGQGWHFDVFVISDSTDQNVASAEYGAALRLSRELSGRMGVYYRRRDKNTGKKAGNVADFVRRWGGAYDHMIVLDADSTMTAEAMIALVADMEANPRAGLIQTVPRLIAKRSLFSRMQQFGSAVYGPVVAAGVAMWQGREGNFWGHNAIIRLKAFAGACGLPELPGRKPFGGHVMSHDFVEAALLRRAGWDVTMRADIEGSFEEPPPSLADHAARDRRWAQGNLQHLAIIPASGLHWVSRFHFVNGVMAYLSSPLWLAFLVIGLVLAWQGAIVLPDYFPNGQSLFPTWPTFDAERALALMSFALVILLVPKMLAVLAAILRPEARKGSGGALAITASFVIETLVSALIAPILMLMQTSFVMQILSGRDSGWNAQSRDDGSMAWSAAAHAHAHHTLAGVVMALAALMIAPSLFLWMLPVWLGLMLSIPLAQATSTVAGGDLTRKFGLFLIPEERAEDRAARDRTAAKTASALS